MVGRDFLRYFCLKPRELALSGACAQTHFTKGAACAHAMMLSSGSHFGSTGQIRKETGVEGRSGAKGVSGLGSREDVDTGESRAKRSIKHASSHRLAVVSGSWTSSSTLQKIGFKSYQIPLNWSSNRSPFRSESRRKFESPVEKQLIPLCHCHFLRAHQNRFLHVHVRQFTIETEREEGESAPC